MILKKKINKVIKLAQKKEKRRKKNPKAPYRALYSALDSYLNSLSFEEVKSLQAIMYLGRDKDYDNNLSPKQIYNSQINYFNKSIGWNTKEIEINQMVEKMPFADYLIEGKKILEI